MSNISLLTLDELKDSSLGPLVKKCLKHKAPDPAFHAIMGHNPELSKSMYIAWGTVFNSGKIDHKLKEIIRVQLSRMADCNYWGNVRSASAKQMGLTEEILDDGIENYEKSENFTKKEKLALLYSELMASNPEKIDCNFYKKLGEFFSEEEIVELGAFIGFNIGYHTFFGTLDFYPMFSPDGKLVDQNESRRIYGDRPLSHLKGAIKRSKEIN